MSSTAAKIEDCAADIDAIAAICSCMSDGTHDIEIGSALYLISRLLRNSHSVLLESIDEVNSMSTELKILRASIQ